MTNSLTFQVDIEDQSSWSLFYRLQSVFQNANPALPEQTFQAMQHVLDSRNIVDHDQHPDSPRRNRPAYLADAVAQEPTSKSAAWVKPEIDPDYRRDWGAKPKAADLSPKDWSTLGR